MQDDEVARVLVHFAHLAIIFVSLDRVEVRVREQREQLHDPALDEMDACRFQRFHETARQPKRDHVGIPGKPPPPGRERQAARVGQGFTFQVGKQLGFCVSVGLMSARVDETVAHPVL